MCCGPKCPSFTCSPPRHSTFSWPRIHFSSLALTAHLTFSLTMTGTFAFSSLINTALLLVLHHLPSPTPPLPSNKVPSAEKKATIFQQCYSWMPAQHLTTFLPNTMEPFNGKQEDSAGHSGDGVRGDGGEELLRSWSVI